MGALDELLTEHVLATEKEDRQTTAQRWTDAQDEVQRRRFVREGAIRFYMRGMRGAAEMYTPQQCWAMAVALWEAKPEDC